jgi:SAM-dependent methyltransferase
VTDPVPGLTCKGFNVDRDGVPVRVTRINVGCGRTLYIDCCNVDINPDNQPDVICDVQQRTPFDDDTFDSVYCSHLIEHLPNPLAFMQELARICCPGAVAIFRVPYGSSDNAWEDPTHVRPYFIDSFGYFSQAAYSGADCGYRGDWTCVNRELVIKPDRGWERFKDNLPELLGYVMTQRNVVDEMKITLRNVKPIRGLEAVESAPISFAFRPSQHAAANESSIVLPNGAKPS